MAVTELQTRIALKYDTYDRWTNENLGENKGANLVLMAGELGICEISAANGASNIAPTVLFKVGGLKYPEGHEKAGQLKAFKDLPWASAKAADVYNWAKAETVELVVDKEEDAEGNEQEIGRRLVFKTGTNEIHSIDLSSFATDAEVAEITNALAERISAIEESIGTGAIADQLEDLDRRLDIIEGDAETAGSISKAAADTLAAAKAYTDTAETDAVNAAKAYTDEQVLVERNRIDALVEEQAEQDETISALDTAYKAADKAITDTIGTLPEGMANLVAGITTNASDLSDLAEIVSGHTTTIADNKTAIETALNNEITARSEADLALDGRLVRVESFFATAEGETLDTALDTLVEIQDYLNGEGQATGGIIGRVAANEDAIEALQGIVLDGGTLESRVDTVEGVAEDAVERIVTLESVVSGYTGAGAIFDAVEAAQDQADKGVEDAKAAKDAADAAQKDVDDLAEYVNNTTNGLAATYSIATKAAEDITTLNGQVSDLQAIVQTGADANDKLRADIKTIQDLVNDSAKGNEKLHSDLTALINRVDDTTTGLAKTNEIANAAKDLADDNAERLTTIENTYMSKNDAYIFQCGDSVEVSHTA